MARQRIVHGATIDCATPEEIAEIIVRAQVRERDQSYRRLKGNIVLDGTGAGTGVETAPRGWDMICERITATAAGGALIGFYENSTQNSDLLEIIGLGSAGLYSDAFSNSLFVPAGSRLFIAVSSGGNNGNATYNIQAKLIKTV